MLTASARLVDFRRDRPDDSFRGWLRGVARNKLRERHRRLGRQVAEAAGGTVAGEVLRAQADPLADTDPDDEAAERSEARALYLRALDLVRDEVEARTWRAFWRVAVDEAPTADVAAELGVSPAAIRQAKSRVFRRIKEVVGDLVD